jgi:hypothetical protein
MIVRGVVGACFVQIGLARCHMAVGAGFPFCFRVLRLGVGRSYDGPQQAGGKYRRGNRALKYFWHRLVVLEPTRVQLYRQSYIQGEISSWQSFLRFDDVSQMTITGHLTT